MRKSSLLMVVMMALAMLLAAAPSQAATTFVVDAPDDDASADECTAAGTEDCSLRGAIIAANSTPEEDVVQVPAGTYTLTITGSNENASATGDLDITQDLVIEGEGADTTTVAGGEGFDDRVFDIPATLATGVSISGLTITGGSIALGDGGGGIQNTGTLAVSESNVSGNSVSVSSNGEGGGIFNLEGTLTVEGSTISDNTSRNGGGLFNRLGALTVSDSTISDNTAVDGAGGGLLSDTEDNPPGRDPRWLTTIKNSTISGNEAGGAGGGVRNFGGPTQIENSTITNNTAPTGGGVSSWDDNLMARTEVLSSIISGNSNTDVDFIGSGLNRNSFVSEGHNLIGDGNATGAFSTAQGDQVGVTDPKLGPLQDNGGITFTHALLQGSPAVDAADDTTCPATDQRGETRPKDGDDDGTETCDIGAFEKKTPPQAPSTPDLNAESDTGISSTDNLTKDTTPTFTGTAQAGTTVKILVDGVEKGADTNTSDGTYSITTTALTAPRHSVSATATDAAGDTTPSSAALRVSIDTRKPRVSSVTSPTTATANLTATFSERMDVTTITGTSTTSSKSFKLYRLVKRSDGTIKRVAVAASVGCTNFMTTSGTIVSMATLNPTNSLPLGNYEAQVTPAARDRAGNALDQNPTTTTTNEPRRWRFTIG